MIENFQNEPPQQQLLVEKIGRIEESEDGKHYKQKQTSTNTSNSFLSLMHRNILFISPEDEFKAKHE